VPDAGRFPIHFTGLNKAMAVLGMSQRSSVVEVDADEVRVRMGWAFRAVIARPSIHGARADDGRVGGWGVHGWRGRWLVNGSARRIVAIDIEPPARARVCFVPVRLRELRVSVADREGFLAALRGG
jgi:hypothetical protein